MTSHKQTITTQTDLSAKLVGNLIKLVGQAKADEIIERRKAAQKNQAELVACGWAK